MPIGWCWLAATVPVKSLGIHEWEPSVGAVRGLLTVAAVAPVFPYETYRRYGGLTATAQ